MPRRIFRLQAGGTAGKQQTRKKWERGRRTRELQKEILRDRRIAELKKLDPIRIFARKLDVQVRNGEHEVPVRIFFSTEEKSREDLARYEGGVFLFFHGGGWATESVDTYERICTELAQTCGQPVLAVEYRRAPEHRFPTALSDSYVAARELYQGNILQRIRPEQITLIGDSAGGNLAAAVSLLARDREEFRPARQILIYPALWNDYTETSPYPSVRENGTGYLLTSAKMEEYLELYQRTPADRQSPYFAPLLAKELSGMPDSLILTAEKDPLRDEGEEYAQRLRQAGCQVELHRLKGAQHGFFGIGIGPLHVTESLALIRAFMKTEGERER